MHTAISELPHIIGAIRIATDLSYRIDRPMHAAVPERSHIIRAKRIATDLL